MGKAFGIVSFIIAIINFILFFLVLPSVIWRTIRTTSPASNNIISVSTLGLIILFLAIIGIILGIIGSAKDETKAFAIVGLVLNIIGLVLILGAMALGISIIPS